MSKKKTSEDELLKHNLIIRVNDSLHQKLTKLLTESDCQSIAEVARKILTSQKINCFYKDASMNEPMEEMALIRKELKAIGVNINQQTRYFNACKTDAEKKFHSDQTVALFTKVEGKVERLFELISKLAERWLQK
ncbi:plasmid mobilization protein [Pedobacter frigoris]|uniref:Mobilization protein n=1 Tax=Pedobacter frigoris TaxID=2571272 RepID=A0A4U1CGT0_9SPHI|nr:mobilization protein [Pedobacter frigoris]TKC04316.1 mobilization protein [Pedobacter frigoris]